MAEVEVKDTRRSRIYPMDVIAGLAIIGYIALLFFNKGSELTSAIAVIIGFYFGNRSTVGTTNNGRQT